MWKNLKTKTTLAGLLAGIAILLTQASYYFDADPRTNPDLTVIIAAFGVFGVGYSASDRPKEQ